MAERVPRKTSVELSEHLTEKRGMLKEFARTVPGVVPGLIGGAVFDAIFLTPPLFMTIGGTVGGVISHAALAKDTEIDALIDGKIKK